MTREEKIIEFLEDLKLDVDFSYIDYDDIYSFDDLMDKLRDNNLLDVDIIYYSNAIEFLKENDPSLNKALELAAEYGFQLHSLDSEILASILATDMLIDELYEHETVIDDFFNDLEIED